MRFPKPESGIPNRKDKPLTNSEGCRDPICIWNGTIIDGHNRYEIYLRHRIPFKTQQISLRNQHEAIAWICANQIGDRNISEDPPKYLTGKRYEFEKVAGILNTSGKTSIPRAMRLRPEYGHNLLLEVM
ncbi:MAG: hypothetical protein ACOYJC_11500 [Christensenellales bacterium]